MVLRRPVRRQKLANRLIGWCVRHRLSVIVVTAAVFALLLWRGPNWFDSSGLRGLTAVQRQTAVNADRGRLMQLGAGLLAAGALLYTALSYHLSREGHVTDRFTKAIEQLGSDRLDVRLGAIYALERIMIDSARDHPTIVEVLAAFVREHTTRIVSDAEELARTLSRMPAAATREDVEKARAFPMEPRTDVQAALTVLGRRLSGRKERGRLNLRATYLAGAELSDAHLARADLTGANLAGAQLTGAELGHAILAGADLSRAELNGADLTNAILFGAGLKNASLYGADLTGSALVNADLTYVDLMNTKVTDAELAGAHLTGDPTD